jgi:hypothetical protein
VILVSDNQDKHPTLTQVEKRGLVTDVVVPIAQTAVGVAVGNKLGGRKPPPSPPPQKDD